MSDSGTVGLTMSWQMNLLQQEEHPAADAKESGVDQNSLCKYACYWTS